MQSPARVAIALASFASSVAALPGRSASAQEAAPAVAVSASAPEPPAVATSTLPEAPPEAPPPLPHKRGLVLEQSLGALGFGGQFRHVAPAGLWLHTQLVYEVLPWLMPFAEGELTFTDTSEADDPSKAHAFPILGFGGGVRARFPLGERVGLLAQLDVGALKADTPKNTLAILGFRDAESFNPYFGGRVGVDWLALDRHLGLGLTLGLRDAQGFAKLAASSDTPLLWDVAAVIRYTF